MNRSEMVLDHRTPSSGLQQSHWYLCTVILTGPGGTDETTKVLK